MLWIQTYQCFTPHLLTLVIKSPFQTLPHQISAVISFGLETDWHYYKCDHDQLSFMSLLVIGEKGQGNVNQGYRRTVKEHVIGVGKLHFWHARLFVRVMWGVLGATWLFLEYVSLQNLFIVSNIHIWAQRWIFVDHNKIVSMVPRDWYSVSEVGNGTRNDENYSANSNNMAFEKYSNS